MDPPAAAEWAGDRGPDRASAGTGRYDDIRVGDARLGAQMAVRAGLEGAQEVVTAAPNAPPLHPRLPRIEFPDGEPDSWQVLGDVTDRSVRVWARAPGGTVDASLLVDGHV